MAITHVSGSAESGARNKPTLRANIFGWLHFALRVFLAVSILAGVYWVLINIGGGPGGAVYHQSPKSIPVGEPYELTFTMTLWYGREWEKYTDVECRYRVVGDKEYTTAPLELIEKKMHRFVYRATLPPLQKASSVEYYLAFKMNGSQNHDDFGPVPVR